MSRSTESCPAWSIAWRQRRYLRSRGRHLCAVPLRYSQERSIAKDPAELDKHGKILYDGLDTAQVSRVRMLAHWHSAAGMSFVAAVHHRAAQCFRYHGNKMHGDGVIEVSLTEFQEAIKSRHLLGSRGIDVDDAHTTAATDFA